MHVCCTYSRYSHSFTLVCRGVIPAYSGWVVDYSRLTAESRRVTCVGVWDETWDSADNFSAAEGPQFRFCPRDKNEQVFGVRNYSKRMTKRVIVFIEAYLAKRIVAGGFIGSCSCRSRGMRKGDKLKSRYRRLCLRPPEQRSLAIYQRYALGRLSACYQSCRGRVESMQQAHKSK